MQSISKVLHFVDLSALSDSQWTWGNWMLFEAYDAAQRGEYHVTRGMLKLFEAPYEEQTVFEEAYFRTTPNWAKSKGGIAFMSWSS